MSCLMMLALMIGAADRAFSIVTAAAIYVCAITTAKPNVTAALIAKTIMTIMRTTE